MRFSHEPGNEQTEMFGKRSGERGEGQTDMLRKRGDAKLRERWSDSVRECCTINDEVCEKKKEEIVLHVQV